MKAVVKKSLQGELEQPEINPDTDNLDEFERGRSGARLHLRSGNSEPSPVTETKHGKFENMDADMPSGDVAVLQPVGIGAEAPGRRRHKSTKPQPSAAMSFLTYMMLFFGAAFLSALVVFAVTT